MSRTQRLALLGVAAIIAVLAIVVLPGSDDTSDTSQPAAQTVEQPASEPAATTATTPVAAPKPKPDPPLLEAGKERELEFTKGETVRFRVRHDAPEEVHVHGYDVSQDIEAGKTRTVSFEATLEGIYEIELEQSGTSIGSLKVEPK